MYVKSYILVNEDIIKH